MGWLSARWACYAAINSEQTVSNHPADPSEPRQRPTAVEVAESLSRCADLGAVEALADEVEFSLAPRDINSPTMLLTLAGLILREARVCSYTAQIEPGCDLAAPTPRDVIGAVIVILRKLHELAPDTVPTPDWVDRPARGEAVH
jgi:hypothetical protein